MTHEAGYWLQQLLNALQLTCFYLPLATAFALIQGITGRIFLSFGDIAMFASFAAIYACFDSQLQGSGDWQSTFISLLLALATTAALGSVVSRTMTKESLGANPQAFMIASVGLSLVLEEIMRLQSNSREVWALPLFEGERYVLADGSFPVQMAKMSLVAMVMSLGIMVFFALLMWRSRFGKNWRACTQSLKLARLCGVDTARVVNWTFIGAAALAAMSGWMAAISYGGTSFSVGLMFGFKAMFASVIGGFGTIRGAVVGAIALAFAEVIWSAAFPITYRDAAVFALMIGILLVRPEGILGVAFRRDSEVV
jgi:branched-chain amino acid transport system permease protein